MDKGVCYTYRATAYPRYRYYHCRLQRLLPRWQRILDAGGLPDCVSPQGRVIFKEISSLAHEIGDKVKVTLFGDPALLKTDKLDLAVQTNTSIVGEVETGEVTWASLTQDTGKKYKSNVTVTVIGVQSLEEKVVKALEAKLSHMSKAQCQNILIFIDESKTSFTYQDLVDAGFKLQAAIDASDSNAVARSKSLNKQIQYLLEENAISVLEEIAAYNKGFVPKQLEDSAESLQDAVQNKLKRSLCNPFVVNDLSPYGKGKSDEERKPTDNELLRISGAVRSDWEVLGPSLGITREKIDDIKRTNQSQQSKVYNMLLVWRQKDGATLKYLLGVMENVSKVTDVDMAVVKDIEDESLALKTESEIDKIFHKKLLDFVAKTTKCVTCDKLSEKYGIPPSLINEFLNDGFFSYEKKVEEMMATISLPSWPRDKSESGVTACKSVLPECIVGIKKVLEEVEDYISVKRELLIVLKKLQFELFGLLQRTDVTIETVIPDIPKLPTELQYGLLQIPEIYGCGTVWGELQLQLTSDLSTAGKEDVKSLLSQHKYMYGYTTQLIETKVQAGGGEDIEQGKALWARKLVPDEGGEYKHGSIGCFIKVKKTGASNIPDERQLHCITCAHCVSGCEARVEIQNSQGFENLGQKTFEIYRGEALDVATIKIDEVQLRKCESTLKGSEENIIRHNWSFYEGLPVKMTVFKYGSQSGLTHGVCICTDQRTKQMFQDWNDQARRNQVERNFDPDYNILIGPPADVPQNTQVHGTGEAAAGQAVQAEEDLSGRVFSEEGDSGSVVCEDNIDTGEVVVISLLCGDIREKLAGNTTKYLYSYSTHIKIVVAKLEEECSCSIEPGKKKYWNGGTQKFTVIAIVVRNEPLHKKTYNLALQPAWIQMSRHIRQSHQDPYCSLSDLK